MAIRVPRMEKARGSWEGLIKTGVMDAPFTNPKSNNLLLIFPSQFNFLIIPFVFKGNSFSVFFVVSYRFTPPNILYFVEK